MITELFTSDIVNFAYGYDSDGNITSQMFDHRTSDPVQAYTYDTLDRLTLVNRGAQNVAYTHNVVNEYSNSVVGGATSTYLYDVAGNLTKDGQNYRYYYDYENRLTKVTDSGNPVQTVAQYGYDGLGRWGGAIPSAGVPGAGGYGFMLLKEAAG